MAQVNLVYMVKPNRGGWPTYTAHLAKGLQQAGHDVTLWKIGNRTETKPRDFGRGLQYRNARVEFLEMLVKGEAVHIAAAEPGSAENVAKLLRAGATITIHDPTELKGGMVDALRESRHRVVAPRVAVARHLRADLGIHSRLVQHPYVRMPHNFPVLHEYNAVAFSRLDWDKGTHHIVAHNKAYGPEKAIYMWGAENRLYTHHKIMEIDPDWTRYYRGVWPVDDLWGGAKIAARSRYAVDLSSIKGDGGGTQYTFLEALDGGAILILNRDWLVEGNIKDEMWDYANFADPEKLLGPVSGEARQMDPSGLFANHDPETRSEETVGLE